MISYRKMIFFKSLELLQLIVSVTPIMACNNNFTEENTPTGYASNELDQPQIMYNNKIYYYWATGFNDELPMEYAQAGPVEQVDNVNPPSENMSGARVDIGQEIYYSDSNSESIYIKYENGFAKKLS